MNATIPWRTVSVLALTCFCLANVDAGMIYSTSFESPPVTGRSIGRVAPVGWVGESGYFAGNYGLENTNSGNYTTPYEAQAAAIFHSSASFTTAAGTLGYNALTPGVTYTVSFNAALPEDQSAGAYRVELVALAVGEARNGNDLGVLLASTNGVATASDMSESNTFSYAAAVDDPNAYKLMAVRIDGSVNGRTLIDNVVFSDDSTSDVSPPILLSVFPVAGSTTAMLDTKLRLSFNENIAKGAGNLVFKRASDHATIETIDVNSGNVTVAGKMLWVSRSVALAPTTSYYVQFGTDLVRDLAGNSCPNDITNATDWTFTTVLEEGPVAIFSDSFESPEVSGSRVKSAPDHWLRDTIGSIYYPTYCGLSRTNTGTFSTPYGAQAGAVWNSPNASLTSKESAFGEVLTSKTTYTVRFNVANSTDMNGTYTVSLVAFDPGGPRSDQSYGTVLTNVSGQASLSDMALEAATVRFTPESSDPSLGKLLGLRIEGSGALVDNISLTSFTPATGTVLAVE